MQLHTKIHNPILISTFSQLPSASNLRPYSLTRLPDDILAKVTEYQNILPELDKGTHISNRTTQI